MSTLSEEGVKRLAANIDALYEELIRRQYARETTVKWVAAAIASGKL